jgi:hypothetical protein
MDVQLDVNAVHHLKVVLAHNIHTTTIKITKTTHATEFPSISESFITSLQWSRGKEIVRDALFDILPDRTRQCEDHKENEDRDSKIEITHFNHLHFASVIFMISEKFSVMESRDPSSISKSVPLE